MKKYFTLLFTLALLLTGFKQNDLTDADADFQKFSDDFISGWLTWRPQTGTYLGFHEYDGKMTDLSRTSIESEVKRLKEAELKLAAIDTLQLSKRNFYDYRILRNNLRSELFSMEEMRGYYDNPMSYAGAIDVSIYVKRDFAPIEDRVRSIIAIEKNAPKVFADARANLDEVLTKQFIQTAILIAEGSTDFLSNDLLIALKDVKNEALMKEFRAVNDAAIKEIKSFAEYLEKEKLPKAKKDFAIGSDNYRKMLYVNEMITMSPEEILELGLKEIAKQKQQYTEAAKIFAPGVPVVEASGLLTKEHPTAEFLISDTKKNTEAIRQFLIDKDIITLPSDVRVLIEETPQYARATGTASMDTPGPFETKSTEAYYYITPVDEKWTDTEKEEWLSQFNYYTTDIVTIHEAYPGHYIQGLHLNASGANKLEKIFGSYAFIEGWAHYTEQMMLEEGFMQDKDPVLAAKYRMAQLSESLLRLCRLCVSIKMHTQGMTIEEGTRFFMDNCFYAEQPSEQESIRGTFDPGYLYYTLGKMQIYKLRDDWKNQEGSNYSLKKFHDNLLKYGMPPLRLLREMMLNDSSIYDRTM